MAEGGCVRHGSSGRERTENMPSKKRPGFAMTELTLTLGASACLLALAWPQRSGDLVASNERAAIASLRQIASAQARLASSGAIDTDDDGIGEFGFFGELAGTASLRVYDPVADTPGLGFGPFLSPPLLPAFGDIFSDHRGENVVRSHGYWFKMFLPDVQNRNDVEGIPEDGPIGIGGSDGALFPDPDTGEQFWCCYAWPIEDQVTGRRAFFVNQLGRVLQTTNDGRPPRTRVYDGLVSTPLFDAAYSVRPARDGLTGMAAPLGSPPRQPNDGNDWTPIGK